MKFLLHFLFLCIWSTKEPAVSYENTRTAYVPLATAVDATIKCKGGVFTQVLQASSFLFISCARRGVEHTRVSHVSLSTARERGGGDGAQCERVKKDSRDVVLACDIQIPTRPTA